MDEKLIQLLGETGQSAETIIYVYMALEFGSFWAFMGLCVWGARTMWKHRGELS